MASTNQIEANRSNARKSTGPRTAAGKARSRRNALSHGLSAREILIPGEDLATYEAFSKRIIDDLQPKGACELDLVERLAAALWRLRRIPRFEATLMARLEYEVIYDDADSSTYDYEVEATEIADAKTAAKWSAQDLDQVKVWGRVLSQALTQNAVLLRLNTYETRLLRQSQQLVAQLFALRKTRTAELILDAKAEVAAVGPDGDSNT